MIDQPFRLCVHLAGDRWRHRALPTAVSLRACLVLCVALAACRSKVPAPDAPVPHLVVSLLNNPEAALANISLVYHARLVALLPAELSTVQAVSKPTAICVSGSPLEMAQEVCRHYKGLKVTTSRGGTIIVAPTTVTMTINKDDYIMPVSFGPCFVQNNELYEHFISAIFGKQAARVWISQPMLEPFSYSGWSLDIEASAYSHIGERTVGLDLAKLADLLDLLPPIGLILATRLDEERAVIRLAEQRRTVWELQLVGRPDWTDKSLAALAEDCGSVTGSKPQAFVCECRQRGATALLPLLDQPLSRGARERLGTVSFEAEFYNSPWALRYAIAELTKPDACDAGVSLALANLDVAGFDDLVIRLLGYPRAGANWRHSIAADLPEISYLDDEMKQRIYRSLECDGNAMRAERIADLKGQYEYVATLDTTSKWSQDYLRDIQEKITAIEKGLPLHPTPDEHLDEVKRRCAILGISFPRTLKKMLPDFDPEKLSKPQPVPSPTSALPVPPRS